MTIGPPGVRLTFLSECAVLIVLMVVGCGPKPAAVPPVAADQIVEPSSMEEPADDSPNLVKTLSIRDPEPECDDATAGLADPVGELTRVANEVQMPPWVPIRAANCLVRHHAEASMDTLLGWAADPDTAGLALVVAQGLDELSETSAVTLGEALIAGPAADRATSYLAKSEHSGVRELVAQ